MDPFSDDIGQWIQFPEDQPTTDGDDLLGQAKDVADCSPFYSADLMLQSRLVEQAALSHPIEEYLSYTGLATPPFHQVQTHSPPLGGALHQTHAAGYPTPPISEPWFTSAPFLPHGAPVMEPHRSPSTVGLGLVDLWQPGSSWPCVGASTGPTCADQLPSSLAWCQGDPLSGDLSIPQWYTKEATLASPHAPISGPTLDSHLSIPHTPASPVYVSTPGSSGASSSTSPETNSVSIPPSRKKRLQRSAPYARPSTSGQQTNPGPSMEDTDAVARENARMRVRKFVKDHPQVVEPSIGDPAAKAIIGSTARLGTPGKSIYSPFFFSGRSDKPRFTCYECGHVDGRFSRAARHQRQDHFGHYPFPCQGGVGHPACDQWFSSEEYAKDHASKAGPTAFICHECSKEFSNVGNLGRHKKKFHHA